METQRRSHKAAEFSEIQDDTQPPSPHVQSSATPGNAPGTARRGQKDTRPKFVRFNYKNIQKTQNAPVLCLQQGESGHQLCQCSGRRWFLNFQLVLSDQSDLQHMKKTSGLLVISRLTPSQPPISFQLSVPALQSRIAADRCSVSTDRVKEQ